MLVRHRDGIVALVRIERTPSLQMMSTSITFDPASVMLEAAADASSAPDERSCTAIATARGSAHTAS